MGNTGNLAGSQLQFGSRHPLESRRPATHLQHAALFLHCPLLLAFVEGHRACQTTHSPGPISPGMLWPPNPDWAHEGKEREQASTHSLFKVPHKVEVAKFPANLNQCPPCTSACTVSLPITAMIHK